MLCLTSHRLVWLPRPGGAGAACGLSLAAVAEVCPPPKQQLFGSRTPRLRLRVYADACGAVCCGAAPYVRLLAVARCC